jgi:hypothetical protein
MHLVKRFGPALPILAVVLLLTACPSQTTISKINADPGRYRNKEVAIVGNVTDSYGVLGNGAYEIDDGTGRLWVGLAWESRATFITASSLVVELSAPCWKRPTAVPSSRKFQFSAP